MVLTSVGCYTGAVQAGVIVHGNQTHEGVMYACGTSGRNVPVEMRMEVFETPHWEIVARGTVVYFAIVILFRFTPKRQTGSLSPNDMIALVIMGGIAGDAIMGGGTAMPDLLLMVVVIMAWDYIVNLAEYRFPRFRRISQDAPTLLIYRGEMLGNNLRKEKLTEEELIASLRKQGVSDVANVHQAILEVDGHISVLEKE